MSEIAAKAHAARRGWQIANNPAGAPSKNGRGRWAAGDLTGGRDVYRMRRERRREKLTSVAKEGEKLDLRLGLMGAFDPFGRSGFSSKRKKGSGTARTQLHRKRKKRTAIPRKAREGPGVWGQGGPSKGQDTLNRATIRQKKEKGRHLHGPARKVKVKKHGTKGANTARCTGRGAERSTLGPATKKNKGSWALSTTTRKKGHKNGDGGVRMREREWTTPEHGAKRGARKGGCAPLSHRPASGRVERTADAGVKGP